ncbi:MAG: nitroreductase family protein [Candidatus Paceibacterota bacterium]|jgi:nitroreductase
MKTVNNRATKYPISDIFLQRYSPRAMSGEKMTEEELMTLFESARWAPSSNNSQPWRFIYAMKNTPSFEKFFALLMEGNKIWCKNASVLIVVISKKNFDNGSLSVTHSFDTGSAWENLALQATNMGFVAHGMAGFNYSLARKELSIPEDYDVEMMITLGKIGKIEDLPEYLREREKPSDRKPLEEIIFEGQFKN